MTVAWIGNRDAQVPLAIEHATALLVKSRCPVITLDTDVDATRAALALARRAGAVCDTLSDGVRQETALFTSSGGMFIAPTEAIRRADVVLIVGTLPPSAMEFLQKLAQTEPDLAGGKSRTVFSLASGDLPDEVAKVARVISARDTSVSGAAALLRSMHAVRRTAVSLEGFEELGVALAEARFVAIVCSDHGCDALALEMLQGFVSDLNTSVRASMVLWPASERGWGSALVSTWNAGFPLPVSFQSGVAEHDPRRFRASRLIEEGEADVWLHVGSEPVSPPDGIELIVLADVANPIDRAAVTIATAEHDSVVFSGMAGTFVAKAAEASAPSAASVLSQILEQLPEREVAPC